MSPDDTTVDVVVEEAKTLTSPAASPLVPNGPTPSATWAADGAAVPSGSTIHHQRPASDNCTSREKDVSRTETMLGYPARNSGDVESAAVSSSTLVARSWRLGVGIASCATNHTSYSVAALNVDAVRTVSTAPAAADCEPDRTAASPAPSVPATTCAAEGVLDPDGNTTQYQVPASLSTTLSVTAESVILPTAG